MLTLSNVKLNYRKRTILQDVNLTVRPGQTVGLLGLNGSGKSTLLLSMAGVKRPAEGEILLDGKTEKEDPKGYHASIGFVTQENALIDELTAMDNLRLWTDMDKEGIRNTLENTNLSVLGVHTWLSTKVSRMSGGMKKRLSIATVLINKPRILLLDEPLAARDLLAKKDILHFLSLFRAGGGLTVVASHDQQIFDFCDDIYLLKDGFCQSLSGLPAGTPVTEVLSR